LIRAAGYGVLAYLLSIVTYLTTGLFLHFAFIRYFWLIIALAGAVLYIADQRAKRAAIALAAPEGTTVLARR
jgi:hypothetical protein